MKKQSDIWLDKEGDNYFRRNRDYMGNRKEICLHLFDLYNLKPQKVLDIGCANGFRLAMIHEKLGCDVCGVEPSIEAITDGEKRYPYIQFINGMAESFKSEDKYDLILLNFVFHWIDRQFLLEAVSNIDNHLKDGGFLLLGDFGTENFLKIPYHHLPNQEVYTYKQQYQKMFLSSGGYLEIAKITYNFDTSELTAEYDVNTMGTITLLKKTSQYMPMQRKQDDKPKK
jgi:SAM-dependent methyltransferase